jgi:hypothetical protein
MKKKHAPKSGYVFFPSISPMREGLYYTFGSLGSFGIKLSHNPCSSLPIPFGATLILIGTIQSPV